MKKHIPLVLAATALCLLPPLCILPLLFGAGGTTTAKSKNCGYVPFNGSCAWSGCNLNITSCYQWNNDAKCDTSGQEKDIVVNTFTCVATNPPDNTKACDPVLDNNGKAATTDCTIIYNCKLNNITGLCQQNLITQRCPAPYYKQDSCP